MICTLEKSVNQIDVFDSKVGKNVKRTITNYQLRFENGEVLPIQVREYYKKPIKDGATKEEKEKYTLEVERLQRINHDNRVKMSTLAVLLPQGE